MADIPDYYRMTGRARARGLSFVPQGQHVDANLVGRRNRDFADFGQTLANAGNEAMRVANVKKERIDQQTVRDIDTEDSKAYRAWEKETLSTKKGIAAADLENEAAKWWDDRKQQNLQNLQGNRQNDLYEAQFTRRKERAVEHMSSYSFQQVEAGNRLSRDKQNEDFLFESLTHGLMNDRLVNDNRQLRHANILANLVGQSDDVKKVALRDSDRELFSAMADAHATRSPENALEYINREDVKAVFTPQELANIKSRYANLMIEDARKNSQEQMRQLGIQLGEDPNITNEIELERSLYSIPDATLAKIARDEANRIRKARLAAGEDMQNNEAAAAVRTSATEIASVANDEAEVDDAVDSLEEVTEAQREEIRKEAVRRLKINQAANQRLENETEAVRAREDAQAIVESAGDELEIYSAADELPNVTEAYRENVRTIATARFKTRQTVESRQKAERENQAMTNLSQSGWNPAAIDPALPADMQVKLSDICEKMQKRTLTKDTIKALDYCALPREQLQQKIRAGEWPQMTVELGGEGTPEYKKVWEKAFSDKPEGSGGHRELLTPLQFAASQFENITGERPNSKGGSQSYAQFLPLFDDALRTRADELGLADVTKVPRKDQRQIVDDLLAQGVYDEGVWYWGRSRRRFEVLNDPAMNPAYFTESARPTPPSNPALPAMDSFPEWARDYFGARDRKRQLLDDGRVLIENQNGTIWIRSPEGATFDIELRAKTPDVLTGAEVTIATFDEPYAELGDVPNP